MTAVDVSTVRIRRPTLTTLQEEITKKVKCAKVTYYYRRYIFRPRDALRIICERFIFKKHLPFTVCKGI